jgi:predicted DNA-binding protein
MTKSTKRKPGRPTLPLEDVRTIMSIRLSPETKLALDLMVENRSRFVESAIREKLGIGANHD